MPETLTVDREFPTFGEFLDKSRNGATDIPEDLRTSRRQESGAWSGTKDFESAARLAESGWAEGLKRIAEIKEHISAAIESRIVRPVPVHSVTGAQVDVGRFLAGVPDCMIGFVPQEVPCQKRVITFLVSISASGVVDAAVIERRGAAVCALVDALEESGLSVEVVANDTMTGYGPHKTHLASYSVTLKRPGEPLELDRLAFALAHPAMLRRIMFSVQEQEKAKTRAAFGFSAEGGYGHPRNPVTGTADIVLGCMRGDDSQWQDEDAALAWVLRELQAQGVELREA